MSLIAVGVMAYLLSQKEEKIIKVPIAIEVPVPAKQGTFPPVEMPKPKTVKPRPKLVEDFQKADSITKDSLYADAVAERIYPLQYKDSTQEINVKTTVQGKLLKQEVDYLIYADTLQVDTVINVTIPKRKFEVLLEGELGIPTRAQMNPVLKGGIHVRPSKGLGLKLHGDTEKRVWIGTSIKLW